MAVIRKYERDIDLFLAEEFLVSPSFANWFLRHTKFHDAACSVVDVFVSKSDASGESDLVVVFEEVTKSRRFALLIEDKIDAGFQLDQQVRYQLRADSELQRGDYSDYQIILCAPRIYRTAQSKAQAFEYFVSYEEIAEFLGQTDTSLRGQYRANFIATAATRTVNTWERIDDEATNKFWAAAYDLASREFVILEMKKPRLTKGSTWVTLRPRDMPTSPKHVYVALKGGQGCVDLTFTYTVAYIFEANVKYLLSDGMTVHQTGKAAAIRFENTPFAISDGPDIALLAVRSAFASAEQLIRFYRDNRSALDKAAQNAALIA